MEKIYHWIHRITKVTQDGYLTIEITMIFPMMFFALLLMLFIGMILYQEVTLQSLAIDASERGSVVYSSRVSDMTTNKKSLEDFSVRDPYRNVPFIDGGTQEDYKSLVNSYVSERIGNRSILSNSNSSSSDYTEIEDYLIAKRVKVNIQSGYEMNVNIPQMFGHNGPFDVNTTAVSAVVDSPDFVRNVDIVTDIIKQTSVFTSVSSGYTKIKEAIEKVTDLLK